MFVELMCLNATLSRWLRTPDAPICKLSLFATEKRRRPYSAKEIRAMRQTIKRYSPQCYIRLFYNEGPFVLPTSPWPFAFCPKGLACSPKDQVGGTAKVTRPRKLGLVTTLVPES